jgi:hypothetical protein
MRIGVKRLNKAIMLLAGTGLAIFTVVPACSLELSPAGSDKPDPAAYPELAPDRLLPAIIADLKRTIPDAYSIRDFLICPARQIKLADGRPVGWTVTFGFNAKSESGGYTGLTSYAITFKDGRIAMHAFSSKMPGKDGFDRLINDAIIKDLLKCSSVPDTRIQELLAQPLTPEN